jgi:hypothetical protein
MNFTDKNKDYDQGFTDGGRYVLGFLVNEHQYEIPASLEIWEDFFEVMPGGIPLSTVIEKERKRILKEIEKIEKQSESTRTPLYQETLIRLIKDRINNG